VHKCRGAQPGETARVDVTSLGVDRPAVSRTHDQVHVDGARPGSAGWEGPGAAAPGLLLLALVVVGDGRSIIGRGSTIAGLAE
jgi:hypothetical protein